MAAIHCENPTYNCASIECECTECPGPEALREELVAAMEENSVETVQYNQWTTTDCANLETHIVPVDEFLDVFIATFKKLLLKTLLQRTKLGSSQRKRKASHQESLLSSLTFQRTTVL